MTAPALPPTFAIPRAIADTIRRIASPLVPTTALASGASAGDTTLSLGDATGFLPGARLRLWDATGERTWAVESVDPDTGILTLGLRGLANRPTAITGLEYDHDENTVVTANLAFSRLVKLGPMLALGGPAIFVYAIGDKGRLKAVGQELPRYQIRLEVRRPLIQPSPDPAFPDEGPEDENDWIAYQELATHADLDTIVRALLKNRTLNDSFGPNAAGLGDPQGEVDYQKLLGSLVVKEDNEQFCGLLDLTVLGLPLGTHA